MATPKVRAACAASVAALAPELPCTLDLGAGNPLPVLAAPAAGAAAASSSSSRPGPAPGAGSSTASGAPDTQPPAGGSPRAGGTARPGSAGGGRGGVTKGLNRARLSLKTAAELGTPEREELFALWKANMGHYAELDYTDRGKWDEMYDPDARYLVIRRQAAAPASGPARSASTSPLARSLRLGSAGPRSDKTEEKEARDDRGAKGGERKRRRMRRGDNGDKGDGGQDQGELLGFASFRFDTEETLSTQDAEVVYCYELQLAPSARRLGLARRLMDALEGIGRRRGMAKSMLTCLVANTSALAFYDRQGYVPDEIDPTRCAEAEGEAAEYSYRILSKQL